MNGDSGARTPDSESWTTTTSYGRADLTQHPLIREAYKVACLIERCGASPELTTASCTAFALCELLSDYFRGLDAGRVNAPSGTTSEPVATEPQGSAGESPAPIPLTSNVVSRLRGERVCNALGHKMLMHEAAEEIERLTRELADAVIVIDTQKVQIDGENAERDRERQNWKKETNSLVRAVEGHQRRNAELCGEIERLRAGLEALTLPGRIAVSTSDWARQVLSGDRSPSETRAHPLDGYCPGKRFIRSKLFQQFLEQDFWHAHHVDLVWRYNGQDVREEADWLKDVWYALREPEDREPIAEGDARYYAPQSAENGEASRHG